jgi:hypothetical protein
LALSTFTKKALVNQEDLPSSSGLSTPEIIIITKLSGLTVRSYNINFVARNNHQNLTHKVDLLTHIRIKSPTVVEYIQHMFVLNISLPKYCLNKSEEGKEISTATTEKWSF